MSFSSRSLIVMIDPVVPFEQVSYNVSIQVLGK